MERSNRRRRYGKSVEHLRCLENADNGTPFAAPSAFTAPWVAAGQFPEEFPHRRPITKWDYLDRESTDTTTKALS